MDIQLFDISCDSDYTSIFSICPDNAISLMNFYLYRMAGTNDSPLSYAIDSVLSDTQKDELLNRLLEKAEINESNLIFSPILRSNIKAIRTLGLSDNTLNCNMTKGFFNINTKSKQHKLDCLFKRIRDSFAHGRIGYKDGYLILEDKTNELTGRFVTTEDLLLKWKVVINNYLNELNLDFKD